MKPKFFFDEIHEQNYWFCHSMKLEDLEKWIRNHYKISAENFDLRDCYEAEGIAFSISNEKTGQYGIWIWLKDYKPGDAGWLSTLAHEAVHAAKMFMHDRGFDLNNRGDEPMAYLVGYLVKKCLEISKKRGR